jgi:uncharacterized protein (TIGR02246 family)
MLCFLALAVTTLGFTAWPGQAQLPKPHAKDKESIARNGEAFVAAFAKGDAGALAALWTENGDYTDQNGRHLKGRAAIEKAFKGLFAGNKGMRARIDSHSLHFVTPDVAIEDGTSAVFSADGAPPHRARYTIVHVKKEGKWLLSSVREALLPPPSNREHLSDLEGLVGDWASEADKGKVERASLAWSPNQNYLVGGVWTTLNNAPISSSRLRIGWDPSAKRIRSWLFDETGGFSEGTWARDGKKWVVKTASVLQDGKKAAVTFVVTPIDADTVAWQARDRSVNGKSLPDGKEVRMKRVK